MGHGCERSAGKTEKLQSIGLHRIQKVENRCIGTPQQILSTFEQFFHIDQNRVGSYASRARYGWIIFVNLRYLNIPIDSVSWPNDCYAKFLFSKFF